MIRLQSAGSCEVLNPRKNGREICSIFGMLYADLKKLEVRVEASPDCSRATRREPGGDPAESVTGGS